MASGIFCEIPELSVNLTHDNVQRPHNGRDVGKRDSLANLVCDGDIAETAAFGTHPQRVSFTVPDNVKPHLTTWSFGFKVYFVFRKLAVELKHFTKAAGRKPCI
jgi:hypothetical protein